MTYDSYEDQIYIEHNLFVNMDLRLCSDLILNIYTKQNPGDI